MKPLRLMIGLIPVLSLLAAGAEVGYYRFPTLHGERIVFAAEGDLWEVPIHGGQATRLTTHEGNEGFPRFSPDGQWLAFSAQYDGNVDVYVMPAAGGEPQRLTYHPMPDEVIAWRPDSEHIVFRSRRESPNGDWFLYEVPRTGGHPQLVKIGRAALAAFSPDGRYVAFNRFSDEFRNWKRYTGGTAQDLWLADLQATGADFARKITDWPGTDTFPMWHAGRLYFLSDRNGRMNVHVMDPDGRNVRALTEHAEYDVRWPDQQGGRIVYMHGGDLWLLDLAAGRSARVEITLPTDRILRRPQVENAAKTLESYELDRKGKRLLVSARGELWVAPTRPGRFIQLTQTSGVRERGGVFSRDGRQVAAITDETGEQELAVWDAAGRAAHRVLTDRGRGWIFPPVWSADGKWLAYADLTQAIFLVDAASGAVTEVDRSDVWEIKDYAFSPDGKWLAYVKPNANRYRSIHLYHVETGARGTVSSGFSDDSEPTWDPQGKYLYFMSERVINPVLDVFDMQHISHDTSRPCLAVLARGGKSPLLPEELLEPEKKPKKKGSADTQAAGETKDEQKRGEQQDEEEDEEEDKLPEVKLDLEDLATRVVELPVKPGNYFGLEAVKGKLLYLSQPRPGLLDDDWLDEDTEPKATLHVYDFDRREDEVLLPKLRDYSLSGNGARIAWRMDEEILVADLDKLGKELDAAELKEKLDLRELPLLVDPRAEWAQIFTEAWRLQRDFYWAENMAGIDWPTMKDRYGRLLPRIATRQELNDLIGQLLGELATSHTYIWGGDARTAQSVGVGLLGADLAPDAAADAWRIVRVLRPELWETNVAAPLTASHASVQDGEYLFGVNGRDLRAADNVYARLANLAEREVLLTVGPRADRSGTRDVQVRTLAHEGELRYRDWVRRNRAWVAARTGGKVGYLHLPDMGGEGLAAFIRQFYPQIETDALIVDVRYNGGGFVSQMIIERLRREVVAWDRPRRGALEKYPYRTHVGPKVVLVNEEAGSDGDIFPYVFQMLKLGPVIGTRTWGGVIGIRGDKTFIDGGLSTQPEYAWFDRRWGWDLENRGVEPDIVVDNRPEDQVAGRDAQLERGLAEIERMLAENPPQRPAPPPVPDKSRMRGG